jgi:hypothetical protein
MRKSSIDGIIIVQSVRRGMLTNLSVWMDWGVLSGMTVCMAMMLFLYREDCVHGPV